MRTVRVAQSHLDALVSAHVPLPEPLPKFVRGPKPGFPWSCYDEANHTVWLLETDWRDRFSIYHELGHCFDRTYLTPVTRQRAARLIGHPGLRWWWGTWNPLRHVKQPNEENFADAYADCAMHPGGWPAFRKFLRTVKKEKKDA